MILAGVPVELELGTPFLGLARDVENSYIFSGQPELHHSSNSNAGSTAVEGTRWGSAAQAFRGDFSDLWSCRM